MNDGPYSDLLHGRRYSNTTIATLLAPSVVMTKDPTAVLNTAPQTLLPEESTVVVPMQLQPATAAPVKWFHKSGLGLPPKCFCPVKNKGKKTTKSQFCGEFTIAHGLASHQSAYPLKADEEKTQKKLPPQQETTISRNNDNNDSSINAQIDDDDDISYNSTDVDKHDKNESRVKNNQRTSTGNDDDDFSRISQGRIYSNNVDINTDIDKNKINLKFDADGVDDPSTTNEDEKGVLVGSGNSPIEFDEDPDNDEQGITIEINDDGDDDEQETIIEIDDDLDDEEISLYVSDNCDDDIQITGSVGIHALSDLPHPRHECVAKPFQKNPEEFCPNCYCYVCDIKASECDKNGLVITVKPMVSG